MELRDAMLLEDSVLYVQEKRYRCESSKNWKQIVRKKAERLPVREVLAISAQEKNASNDFQMICLLHSVTECLHYVTVCKHSVTDKSFENHKVIRRVFFLCSSYHFHVCCIYVLKAAWSHQR